MLFTCRGGGQISQLPINAFQLGVVKCPQLVHVCLQLSAVASLHLHLHLHLLHLLLILLQARAMVKGTTFTGSPSGDVSMAMVKGNTFTGSPLGDVSMAMVKGITFTGSPTGEVSMAMVKGTTFTRSPLGDISMAMVESTTFTGSMLDDVSMAMVKGITGLCQVMFQCLWLKAQLSQGPPRMVFPNKERQGGTYPEIYRHICVMKINRWGSV